MKCCIYDEIFIAILMKNKKYNYILQSQNIQFLRVDKIGFPKPITFYDRLHTPHPHPSYLYFWLALVDIVAIMWLCVMQIACIWLASLKLLGNTIAQTPYFRDLATTLDFPFHKSLNLS